MSNLFGMPSRRYFANLSGKAQEADQGRVRGYEVRAMWPVSRAALAAVALGAIGI
jgi:hypothetical protein